MLTPIKRVKDYVYTKSKSKITAFVPDITPEKVQNLKQLTFAVLKKTVINSVFLTVCFTIGILFHIIVYLLLIPHVNQSVQLSFTKNERGYLASVLKSGADNSLCAFSYDTGKLTLEENFEVSKKLICSSSMKTSLEELYLQSEHYSINIEITLPDIPENYQIGSFALNAYLLNKNNDAYRISRLVSMYNQETVFIVKHYWRRILVLLGLDDPMKRIVINLTDKLPNNILDAQGLVVQITEGRLVMLQATINFEAKLRGFRYFLYHWFWSSSFLLINIYSFALFAVLLVVQILLFIFPYLFERYLKVYLKKYL